MGEGLAHTHEPDDELYPEHAKLGGYERVATITQRIGEWLDHTGYAICELQCIICGAVDNELDSPRTLAGGQTCDHPDHYVQYVRLRRQVTELLADAVGIDLGRLENEKRRMLIELRVRPIEDVDTEVV